jgi:SAM-dependent methyltransferase
MDAVNPQPSPQSEDERKIYAELAQLVSDIRQQQDRNREQRRLLDERLRTQQQNTEEYKRNILFYDVLCMTLQQDRVLSFILAEAAFGQPDPVTPPPREPPADMHAALTRGGRIPLSFSFHDDTYPGNYPLIYSTAEIEAYLRHIAEGQTYIYGGLDISLREAFEKYPVRGLRVVNLGSITPWYEATLLHFGAVPTTLDYNTIVVEDERITALTVHEIEHRDDMQFDAALSLSSFEHDGLGAYGDALDPDGDLKAMRQLKRIIRPGGLLYLNVPVGPDAVAFNRARTYGAIRLPLLFEGWTWIDSFALQGEFLQGASDGSPLFVLRNDG